jgi:hypothetical protein
MTDVNSKDGEQYEFVQTWAKSKKKNKFNIDSDSEEEYKEQEDSGDEDYK